MRLRFSFNGTARHRLFIAVITCCTIVAKAQVYDVTAFGAKGDGITDNTTFIQKAIDQCATTGGQVYFPAGTFLSGTLYLKSYVTLHLTEKATLLGHTDISKYPYLNAGISFYGENWAKQALIFCKNAEYVSIEGNGTIDGQGASFVITTNKKPDRYKNRPYLLWFAGSKHIRVKGVHLRNSAFWMQHYLGCEDLLIDGISIWNHSNKNNDMMDIDGCKNVIVSNVNGDSDDDGLTLKSTSPLITENVSITNCVLSSHCNALKMGTESTGGFRNITISNCVIKPSAQHAIIYGLPAGTSGISLEVVDGALMENVTINNIAIDGPEVPLFVRLGNRARKYTDTAATPAPGVIRNVQLSNITAINVGETASSITGVPNALVQDVTLSNITITAKGGGIAADMLTKVEELEDEYPEATMFGKLPAYGLYIRHANGIQLNNVSFRFRNAEERPALFFASVKQFSVTGLNAQTQSNTNAVINLTNSSNGFITNTVQHYPARSFVRKDAQSVNITTTNNYTPAIKSR
ncbi:MAG: glycosyl hydrolase family 28 protein [Chitinophagaceae bacterium]